MELVLTQTSEREEIDYDAIRASVDLLEVASQYTKLTKRGRRFVGICPLHQEKTPSFSVAPEDGWYCHGCHQGGDVIKLVALVEKIRNSEAARKLATDHNINFRVTRFQQVARKTARHMEGWRERQEAPPPLEQGEVPLSIPLESYRGFSPEAIRHFGLRLIPGNEWGSGVYIPIKDGDGTLIGYSIRQPDHLKPKYLNSQGLKKQGIIFGLAENKQAIEERGYVMLVEGQFDAIRMWDRGQKNVLAVMGSSISIDQALKLARVTTKLVLVFDGDTAGRHGTKQTKDRFGSAFDIEELVLAEGEDPCNYFI